MEFSLYGFEHKWLRENGKWLAISREGLADSDLEELQMNMILANPIPRILPIKIEERDMQVRLIYEIGYRKSLQEILAGRRIYLKEVCQILFSAVSLLEDSTNFMLNQRNIVFRPDFVFVSKNLEDAAFLYLPVKEVEGLGSSQDNLKVLAGELVERLGGIPGPLEQALRYLDDPQFQIKELKRLLIDLIDGFDSTARRPQVNQGQSPQQMGPFSPAVQAPQHQPFAGPPAQLPPLAPPPAVFPGFQVPQQPLQQPFQQPSLQPPYQQPFEQGQRVLSGPGEGRAVGAPQKKSNTGSILYAVGALAIAGIWKVYSDYFDGTGSLFFSIGLSILVINLVMWFQYFQARGVLEEAAMPAPGFSGVPQGMQAPSFPGASIAPQPNSNAPINHDVPAFQEIGPKPLPNHGRPSAFAGIDQAAFPVNNSADYYQHLGQNTDLLGGAAENTEMFAATDETVLLSDTMLGVQPMMVAFLETRKGEQVLQVPLYQKSVVIGRGEDGATYSDDRVGISRIHLEVFPMGRGFGVKDLGSKNGSWLNGVKLEPFKLHPLQDGDVIRVAKYDYIFRVDRNV